MVLFCHQQPVSREQQESRICFSNQRPLMSDWHVQCRLTNYITGFYGLSTRCCIRSLADTLRYNALDVSIWNQLSRTQNRSALIPIMNLQVSAGNDVHSVRRHALVKHDLVPFDQDRSDEITEWL